MKYCFQVIILQFFSEVRGTKYLNTRKFETSLFFSNVCQELLESTYLVSNLGEPLAYSMIIYGLKALSIFFNIKCSKKMFMFENFFFLNIHGVSDASAQCSHSKVCIWSNHYLSG